MLELGSIVNEIVDALGEAFSLQEYGKITFSCTTAITPLDILGYLENYGVYSKPALGARWEGESSVILSVYVRPGQLNYAAGLIEGYAPGTVKVLDPLNVKPIAPKRSWGRPVRTKGVLANILRAFR